MDKEKNDKGRLIKILEGALSYFYQSKIILSAIGSFAYTFIRRGPFHKSTIKGKIIKLEEGLFEVFDKEIINERILISLRIKNPKQIIKKIIPGHTILRKVTKDEHVVIQYNEIIGRLKVNKYVFTYVPIEASYFGS